MGLGLIETHAVVSVTLVLALVEVVKRAWPKVANSEFPAELLPILGIVVGIGFHAFMGMPEWREAVAAGVISGLVASGIYSSAKAVAGK